MIQDQNAELEKKKPENDPIHIKYKEAKNKHDNCLKSLVEREAMVKKGQEDIKELESKLEHLEKKRLT